MKLFKSLLVAPATLGLLAPMSANATEVNINEMANYSDIESIEFVNSFSSVDSNLDLRLAGGEGLVEDNSHDGGFSETTTASFSSNFYIGATDTDDGSSTANDTDDSITAGYDFLIGLNTSFTGEDSFDIEIQAGNAATFGEFDSDSTAGDFLQVDGVSYTFPVGDKTTVFVGDNTDGSLLFTTACVYGGPSNTLDDCGNLYGALDGGAGTAFGASYDFGNGFTTAVGITTDPSSVLTEESNDASAVNLAYTGDNYGVSLTYADYDQIQAGATDSTIWSLNGYYTPDADGMPSISVGYETAETAIPTISTSDTDSSHWFIGLSWDEVGPGSAGLAVGTKEHTLDAAGYEEQLMYEAYYSYPINDGMTITPLVFIKEVSTTGIDDETGVMVKTSFSF